MTTIDLINIGGEILLLMVVGTIVRFHFGRIKEMVSREELNARLRTNQEELNARLDMIEYKLKKLSEVLGDITHTELKKD